MEELTVGGQTIAKVKIQRSSLQRDSTLALLFVLPLKYVFRKCTGGYKFTKLQENIYNLKYIDGMKIFAKKEKEVETLIQTVRIYSEDIGMEFSIENVPCS